MSLCECITVSTSIALYTHTSSLWVSRKVLPPRLQPPSAAALPVERGRDDYQQLSFSLFSFLFLRDCFLCRHHPFVYFNCILTCVECGKIACRVSLRQLLPLHQHLTFFLVYLFCLLLPPTNDYHSWSFLLHSLWFFSPCPIIWSQSTTLEGLSS